MSPKSERNKEKETQKQKKSVRFQRFGLSHLNLYLWKFSVFTFSAYLDVIGPLNNF